MAKLQARENQGVGKKTILPIVSVLAFLTAVFLLAYLPIRDLDKQGPCAFLLRDAALGRSNSHRNFLKSPEIVEDLALQLNGTRYNEILEEY